MTGLAAGRAALVALALLAGLAAARAADDLPWSAAPGAFEAQLQRKSDNPLFPPAERRITAEQVRAAQARDRADAEALRREFDKLVVAIGDRSQSSRPGAVVAQLEAVFELRRQAAGIGGPADAMAGALKALRGWLLDGVAARLADDPAGLRSLTRLAARREALARVVTDPFIAQMQRMDGPIADADAAATLLSEPPEAIRRFMGILREETRQSFRESAARIAERVRFEGGEVAGLDEKLAAMK